MIPLHLSLSGFLSYRDPVELDFRAFDLACISGANGAGKSSLLDAITWALFGQARRRDDALIHTHPEVKAAEVTFTFQYETNTYRVQRVKPRGKGAVLEFHIQTASGDWKPLTERRMRDTQDRIQETLRLDYETFVNAAFFLQGKADQFTQQRPADRKRILSSILGLEVWETYRQRAAERRRAVETDIEGLDGRLEEIKFELDQEDDRKTRLKELEETLSSLTKAREAQEKTVETLRAAAASLRQQEELVNTLARQLQSAEKSLADLQTRQASRKEEQASHAEIINRAEAIHAALEAWQDSVSELERWEEIAAKFREQEGRRHQPLNAISSEQARLDEQAKTLQAQFAELEAAQAEVPEIQSQLEAAQEEVKAAEAQIARRAELDGQLQEARQKEADAKAENPRLKAEMEELRDRITQLKAAEGADCPLCGQPLNPEDRQKLIDDLSTEGKEKGDSFRANKALMEETGQVVKALEAEIAALGKAEESLRGRTRAAYALNLQIVQVEEKQSAWEKESAPRLAEIAETLEKESYAPEARAQLAEIDLELQAIGYDTPAHDAARKAEAEGRASQEGLRNLEKAQAALAPLEREIAGLETQIIDQEARLKTQGEQHTQAAASLAEAQTQAPDIAGLERELYSLHEQENQHRLDVGAAQQKVQVLDSLKERRAELDAQRAELGGQVGHLRSLERAFGKSGAPALLIEQALPQIENSANEILERLSGDTMAVRFVTQTAYKDKKRTDLRETLDIQISDRAGMRDYEMFSGGEAFRINFAIRLALSEVLARRSGARLQTLVIDEGFGSQDQMGRQRLVEAINTVRDDFAKILVITHIEELKDAFPTRIEVQKTERGSVVEVV